MGDHRTKPNRARLLGAAVLSAVVGGAAFLTWREHAPLARYYRRAKRRRADRGAGAADGPRSADIAPPFDPGPERGADSDAERRPGTDPV